MKAPMIKGTKDMLSDLIPELSFMGYKISPIKWPDEYILYLVTNAYGERGTVGVFPYSYVISSRDLTANKKNS